MYANGSTRLIFGGFDKGCDATKAGMGPATGYRLQSDPVLPSQKKARRAAAG